MASFSRKMKARRRLRDRKAGLKRKRKASKRSTLSYEELFAGLGKPGEG